jgi:hypothetical protein
MVRSGNPDFINTMVPIFDHSSTEGLKEEATSGVYTSHLYPRHMPKHFMEKRCKIIHIYRNPKDVAVSYFNFSKKLRKYDMEDMDFSEYLRHYLTGNGKVLSSFILSNHLHMVHEVHIRETQAYLYKNTYRNH